MGKKYTRLDYIAVVNLTMGMVVFSVGDSFVTAEFPIRGVVYVSIALLADAVIGNVQEKSMNKYSSSTAEMIFYSKLIGSGYLLVVLFIKGEFFVAFWYCWENPFTYVYLAVFYFYSYFFLSVDIFSCWMLRRIFCNDSGKRIWCIDGCNSNFLS